MDRSRKANGEPWYRPPIPLWRRLAMISSTFAGLQDGPSECAALGYAKPLPSFKGDHGRTWMHQKTKGYFTVDFCPDKLSPKMHAVSPAYGSFMQFPRSGSPKIDAFLFHF